jgi:signal peptidase I
MVWPRLSSLGCRLRRPVERVVLLLAALLLLRTWCVQGVVVPCRVSGDSMAETLLGVHREVVCVDCGYPFACGSDPPPVRPRAVCPNCGYAGNDLASQPDLAGDGVLLQKSVFRFRAPRRWELAAFASPRDAAKMLVKRVVGLPGESIRIEDGHVYVDGQVPRKTLSEQRAMRVPVYDANYAPTRGLALPARWQGEGRQSQWGSAGGRFVRPAASSDQPPIDWLFYTHWRRAGGNDNEVREEPITDECAYNQALPRRVEDFHAVTDVMLSLRLVETFGQGSLVIRASDGRGDFQVWLDAGASLYKVLQNGRPVPAASGKLPRAPEGMLIEVSLFDQQLLLAFDGRTAVTWPYDPSERPLRPTARPLAVGSQGLGVVVRDLRVYRNVYYTRPVGFEGRWGLDKPIRLGPDQYFVLGDNSPISDDSRTWPDGPAVDAKLLIGKPLIVLFPARRVSWFGWALQVPDLTRIRYVR